MAGTFSSFSDSEEFEEALELSLMSRILKFIEKSIDNICRISRKLNTASDL